MKNKSIIKKIAVILAFVIGIIAGVYLISAVFYIYLLYSQNKFVKGDIDKIKYAEPTQEAKDFNIEEYAKSLPKVEYTKIDYSIKEIYTYEFNNYILTIDIPKGLEAYIKKEKKMKVIDSEGIEDSVYCFGREGCYGPWDKGLWFYNEKANVSDNILHIVDAEDIKTRKSNSRMDFDGIIIYPHKSPFKGVSVRDMYVESEIKKLNSSAQSNLNNVIINNNNFIIRQEEKSIYASLLISDQQYITVSMNDNCFDSIYPSKDLFFSILDSIKIKEK